MKKFLVVADKIIAFILENIAAVMTCAIFLIIVGVVFMRFVLRASSGGFEELPTYFMMIAIWFGAAMCARNPKEGLIRIDLLETLLKKRPLAQAVVGIVASVLSISCIGLYTYLSWKYVVFTYSSHAGTLALGFPMWVLTGLTFVACFFLLVYEIVNLIQNCRAVKATVEAGRLAP
jgi:TRAP-type C4-dicarboxylate transport system permease small subunit